MPKPFSQIRPQIVYFDTGSLNLQKRNRTQQTLTNFVKTKNCLICGVISTKLVCALCKENPGSVSLVLSNRIREESLRDSSLRNICTNCCGFIQQTDLFQSNTFIGIECCISIDCSIFFERFKSVIRQEDIITYCKEIEKDSEYGLNIF
jgi:hypothetical protein